MMAKHSKDRGLQEETAPCPICNGAKCPACKRRKPCPACPCSSCSECAGRGRKGTGTWWIRYHDQNGTEHRERVGNKTAARELYASRKTDARRGRLDPEAIGQQVRILVREVIEDYLREAATKLSAKDDKRYGEVWTKELGHLALEDVRPSDVEKWRRKKSREAGRKDESIKPATLNRYVAFLKRVFNVAIREGQCRDNPVRAIGLLRENNARIRWLKEHEEEALRKHLPSDLWHFVEVAYLTGMRQAEQMSLRWDHVDFANGILTIPRSKHGERRHVPMSTGVREILREMPSRGKSPWVYPGRFPDEHASFGKIRKHFESALVAAGIEDFHWHDLRHTFASRLVMAGRDLLEVKELLGHKTLAMTLRYAHLAPGKLAQAVEALCTPRSTCLPVEPSSEPSSAKTSHAGTVAGVSTEKKRKRFCKP